MALFSVILVMLLVSALCAALAVSGQTEVLVARNHQSAAAAHAAAEAGLNHAVEVTLANLAQWQANGFANSSAAMSALLRGPDNQVGTVLTNADNGSLVNQGIPTPPARLGLGAGGVSYEARVLDDDDPARPITLAAPDLVRIQEDGTATADANDRIVVRATGFAPGGTRVVLEALISPVSLPAIVTNKDLTISGNPTVTGLAGGVHSNEDLTISGNPSIAQDATASGSYSFSGNPTIGGMAGGSQPMLTVPPVNASDHFNKANFLLTSTGLLRALNNGVVGAVLCDASSANDACESLGYGWVFQPGGPVGWKIGGNSVLPVGEGTYYVQGYAGISGNPGSPANPLPLTIIAEGSIEISGNPDLRPAFLGPPSLLFVTNGDLKINGTTGTPLTVEGQMLVHEQIMISGNPILSGQILVEDAVNLSTLVVGNSISGNPTISYNGTLGGNVFTVTGWREVR
jgi:hypothetical protein